MMGNIFAKHKKDTDTALQYYNQALVANPEDFITLTNIGAQLAQLGRFAEAKTFLNKALSQKSDYPNVHMSFALVYKLEKDYSASFSSAVACIKTLDSQASMYAPALSFLREAAHTLAAHTTTDALVSDYQQQLAQQGKKEIKIEADETLKTAAKIEFAEYYNRPYHLVKYKPSHANKEHLIMHELVHLHFVIQARELQVNKKYTSNQRSLDLFKKDIAGALRKLVKKGLKHEAIAGYTQTIFDGLNSQVYNTPIDLFIEDYLHHTYPTLRAYQFLSVGKILHEGITAVTHKDIVAYSPASILSKSKIYTMVLATQYKALYGVDLLPAFEASTKEIKMVATLYEEYVEYKDDRGPGEEYEILQHWAEDLGVEPYFTLVDEVKIRVDDDIEELLTSIEQDPHELDTPDAAKEAKMAEFQKAAKEAGTNFAVVMYMVEALSYFRGMPVDKVKEIAFEIAMQGAQGYSPQGKSYRISAVPNKKFSGYHILAYYYVSWSIAMPHAVSELGIDYAAEYAMAKGIGKI